MQLDIAEVARSTGTPASTLRYYEEKGLIRFVGRRGLKRLFDPTVLQQLSLIALARAGGFSLDEIAAMFEPDGRARIDKAQLRAKADELDGAIHKLERMRDGLRHIADCQAPNQLECPRFCRIVRIAGKGRFETLPRRRFTAEPA